MQASQNFEKQVVIIIPTHNRQHYFSRLFNYYAGWQCNFVIVDSSRNKFTDELPSNFTYLHFIGQSFYEKIINSLELIDPLYVALCADDDVLSERGLRDCVSELALGNCGICNGKIAKYYQQEFGKWFYERQDVAKVRHYPKGSRQPRLLAEYSQVLWSVYERGLLLEIFSVLRKLKPKNDNYIELIIASVGQYRAGITVLPELFLMREISPSLSWGGTAVPLGAELGNESMLERRRLIEQVSMIITGCPIKDDFASYRKNNPVGFFSYIKFRIYQRLAQYKRFGWHGKRETQGYDRIRWR
jgi:glycosyltransferase domain-containing protein